MRVVYLTDRVSLRGGADHHLLQVIAGARRAGDDVVVGFGRIDRDAPVPEGVVGVKVGGLSAAIETRRRLGSLAGLLERADVVHVQNVMNPVALEMAAATGRAVVTVQDHRMFCPGAGRTLPDGQRCRRTMSLAACSECVPDRAYLARTIELTALRRDALGRARCLVLSQYMADELEAAAGCRAQVIPPWVEVGADRGDPGHGFALGGRLVVHKAPFDGWLAWKLAATGQPLHVAGEGPLASELHGATRHGWLGLVDLRRLLARVRALLFPGFWQEPFGILGVEALALATPVIVAETGGTASWSGVGCVKVPAGDVRAMAAAIAELARDPEAALDLGRAGQAAVAKRFSRAVIEARLRAVYDEVAGARRRA